MATTSVISGLANTLFDDFIGQRGTVQYNSAPTVEYPDHTQNAIFGTVLLPRVYGKDLTSFEVASSGKVAVTLDDVHSLDMTRDLATSNVGFSTLCNDSFEINVNGSNAYIKMDGSSNNVSTYAMNNFGVQTGKDVSLTAAESVFVKAGSNLHVSASNVRFMDAADTAVYSDTIELTAAKTLNLASSNVAEAFGDSYSLKVGVSNMTVTMDASNNTITTSTLNDYLVSACNDTTLKTLRDLSLVAQDGTTYNVIDLKNTTNEILLKSTGTVEFDVNSNKLLTIDSSNVNIFGNLNFEGSAVDLAVKQQLSLVSSNIDITAHTDYKVAVNSSNMTMEMNSSNNTITTTTTKDFLVSACNDTSIETQKNMTLSAVDGTLLNSIELKNSTNEILMKTTGTFGFDVDNTRVVSIDNSNLTVYGNLDVQGTLNRIHVTETDLLIEDKEIVLAAGSNFVNTDLSTYVKDGKGNDHSGLEVSGIPTGIVVPTDQTDATIASYYEKSLKWNNNTGGVLALGGADPTTEAQWELKGGAFYITNTRVDSTTGEKQSDTSFGFRINQRDQLEMVKRYVPPGSNAAVTKTVAKFGYSLATL